MALISSGSIVQALARELHQVETGFPAREWPRFSPSVPIISLRKLGKQLMQRDRKWKQSAAMGADNRSATRYVGHVPADWPRVLRVMSSTACREPG
jgi:hypothetical protein